MKSFFTYLLIIFCSICLNAQTSTFIKTYNNYDRVDIYNINNKNYINYTMASGSVGFTSQLTDNGDTLKAKSYAIFNKSNTPFLHNGNWQNDIIVSTTTYPYVPNVYGTLFTKTDTNLNYSIFKKYTRTTNNAFAVVPNEQKDSSFLFAGLTSQNPNSIYPWDIAIMKTDKNGNPLWTKKYDLGFSDANNGSIIVNDDKTMIIKGGTELTGSADDSDVLLLKLDSLGNQLWAKAIGGYGIDGGKLFRINNYYYSIGTSRSYGGTNSSGICLYKIDTLGNLINAKYISGAIQPQPSDISYNNNGTFTLTGISDYPSFGNWDFMAMQIDTNGVVLSNKVYSLGTGEDYGLNFVKTNDGGYIFNCLSRMGTGPEYPLLFKTDSLFNSGCLPSYSANFTTTDVTSQTHDTSIIFNVTNITINVGADTILPTTDTYSVNTDCFGYVGIDEKKTEENNFEIYPNPAQNVININYQLPDDAAEAIVNTYDYTGKLINSQAIYGNKGLTTLNVETLPNGLYMYTIIVNATTIASQRIVISK